jgi:hypothetical protein
MTRKVRWRRFHCPHCGAVVSNNALGKAAHLRSDLCARGSALRHEPYLANALKLVGALARAVRPERLI